MERDEHPTLAAEYLDNLLAGEEDLGPKPERVSEEFADTRIREKISRFDTDRQRAGLWSINETLKSHDVPPALRLHLVSAVVHLSRVAGESLEDRRERSGAVTRDA
jgi:hypothetical protein